MDITKEKAIESLKDLLDSNYVDSFTDEENEALIRGIKALEKEPILDKIRAEIDSINLNEVATKYEDRFYGFQREVIKIIDKYRGEA